MRLSCIANNQVPWDHQKAVPHIKRISTHLISSSMVCSEIRAYMNLITYCDLRHFLFLPSSNRRRLCPLYFGRCRSISAHTWSETMKLSCLTKPTIWHMRPAKTQISLGSRPVWSKSLLCAQWVLKDPSFLHVDSKDFDQTGRMIRSESSLGAQVILLVLSHTGSNTNTIMTLSTETNLLGQRSVASIGAIWSGSTDYALCYSFFLLHLLDT